MRIILTCLFAIIGICLNGCSSSKKFLPEAPAVIPVAEEVKDSKPTYLYKFKIYEKLKDTLVAIMQDAIKDITDPEEKVIVVDTVCDALIGYAKKNITNTETRIRVVNTICDALIYDELKKLSEVIRNYEEAYNKPGEIAVDKIQTVPVEKEPDKTEPVAELLDSTKLDKAIKAKQAKEENELINVTEHLQSSRNDDTIEEYSQKKWGDTRSLEHQIADEDSCPRYWALGRDNVSVAPLYEEYDINHMRIRVEDASFAKKENEEIREYEAARKRVEKLTLEDKAKEEALKNWGPWLYQRTYDILSSDAVKYCIIALSVGHAGYGVIRFFLWRYGYIDFARGLTIQFKICSIGPFSLWTNVNGVPGFAIKAGIGRFALSIYEKHPWQPPAAALVAAR